MSMPVLIDEYLKAKLKQRIDRELNVDSIDHTVDIIRTDYRIDEAVIESAGKGRDWDQQTRTSTANCTHKDMTETLTFGVKETKTTTWTVTSEVIIGSETTFSASGTFGKPDTGAGTVGVSEKLSVSVKVGGSRTSTTSEEVSITDAITVTVEPQTRVVVTGTVHGTPVHGVIRGAIVVRFWHSYTLHFRLASNQQILRYQAIEEIPFEIDFDTVYLSFTKYSRVESIDCAKYKMGDQVGMLNPLEGKPLVPTTSTATASVSVSEPHPQGELG